MLSQAKLSVSKGSKQSVGLHNFADTLRTSFLYGKH